MSCKFENNNLQSFITRTFNHKDIDLIIMKSVPIVEKYYKNINIQFTTNFAKNAMGKYIHNNDQQEFMFHALMPIALRNIHSKLSLMHENNINGIRSMFGLDETQNLEASILKKWKNKGLEYKSLVKSIANDIDRYTRLSKDASIEDYASAKNFSYSVAQSLVKMLELAGYLQMNELLLKKFKKILNWLIT